MVAATKEKILFSTDPDDWHEMSSEKMWSSQVSPGKYRIENVPLYMYGVSYGDIVAAKKDGDDLIFDRVVIKGGNSTYRLLMKANVPRSEFEKRWVELGNMGCFYESSVNPEDVFGVSVPPEADIHVVYGILERGFDEGIWHLDEGNFEHQS